MSSTKVLATALLALAPLAHSPRPQCRPRKTLVRRRLGRNQRHRTGDRLHREEHLGLRANGGFLDYSRSENIDDIDYDGKLKLKIPSACWPTGIRSRVASGSLPVPSSSSNKIDLHTTPTANVEIGNVSYTPAQAGNLDRC